MSGIYGCVLAHNEEEHNVKKALSYWNKEYGSKELIYSKENVVLAVNLEHFSKRVPEQGAFLKRDNMIAVIDAVLFNRSELKDVLGYSAEHMSDEELLFEIICRKGFDFLKNVNGDFAGAVYDISKKEMVLFRDHLGLRPIYYYIDDERLLFATDIRSILAYDALNITIDECKIYEQACGYFYRYENNTEYNEIHYLRKASYVQIDVSAVPFRQQKQTIYWRPGSKKIRYKSNEEYQRELRRLVEDAIKIRMDVSDAPIGAELSGGLDSTVISSLVNRSGREGRYFSWCIDPEVRPIADDKDERILIEEICKREHIHCEYRKGFNPEEHATINEMAQKVLPPFVNALTMSSASAWFQTQGVQVVLTGHGGDEGISHRSRLYELWYHKEYYHYLKEIYKRTEGKSFRFLRTLKWTKERLEREDPKIKRASFETDSIKQYLNPEYIKKMDEIFPETEYTFLYDVVKYIEQGVIRHRMDNSVFQTPKYGIRYLYPYLDYRVLDFGVSIPRNQFQKNCTDRWIYRQTFQDLMPPSIEALYTKRSRIIDEDRVLTEAEKEECEASIRDVIRAMDWEFWSDYLDSEKVKEIALPEGATRKDAKLMHYMNARFIALFLIHSALKQASVPLQKSVEDY